jgi:hypothetical protein
MCVLEVKVVLPRGVELFKEVPRVVDVLRRHGTMIHMVAGKDEVGPYVRIRFSVENEKSDPCQWFYDLASKLIEATSVEVVAHVE